MKSLKIIVAFHGAVTHSECFQEPEFFVPVYGGRVTTIHVPKMLQEMQGDDGPDNISWTNPYIGELTCLYWAWKHLDQIGRPERIGLNHYRRLFPIRPMLPELEAHDQKDYVLTTSASLGAPILIGAEAIYGIGELTKQTLEFIALTQEEKQLLTEFLQRREYAEKNLFVIPTSELDGYMQKVVMATTYLSQYFKLFGYVGASYTRLTARVMEFVTAYYLFLLIKRGYIRLVTKYEYPWKEFALYEHFNRRCRVDRLYLC